MMAFDTLIGDVHDKKFHFYSGHFAYYVQEIPNMSLNKPIEDLSEYEYSLVDAPFFKAVVSWSSSTRIPRYIVVIAKLTSHNVNHLNSTELRRYRLFLDPHQHADDARQVSS